MFIHEELIVAGGGDISYAEVVQFGRHFCRRLRKAALQAAVLTPILWTGFFLLNYFVSVGFSDAFNWREIIGIWEAFNLREIIEFWEEPKWGKIVGLWAVITLLGLVPNSIWAMLRHY